MCAYRWQLACNTDGDCGAGFNCVPSVQVTCPTRSGGGTPSSGSSSGAGGSASSGGAATPPTKDGDGTVGGTGGGTGGSTGSVAECTTTTAFPGSCQPKVTTCSADSDCPSAWTCRELPTAGGTGVGSGGNTGTAGPLPADQPLSTPTVATTTPPPDSTATQMVCVSPYGAVARDASPPSGGPTSGGTTTGSSGSSNGGSGGTSGAPTAAPTEKGGAQATDDAHDTSSAGGCAVAANDAPNVTSSLAAGLMLVGLIVGARRRSRR
jgi:MYXO-CTERM domain-containing protein